MAGEKHRRDGGAPRFGSWEEERVRGREEEE